MLAEIPQNCFQTCRQLDLFLLASKYIKYLKSILFYSLNYCLILVFTVLSSKP